MASYTAVTSRSTVTLSLVKTYMRVDIADEDTIITMMLAAAKQRADTYLNNPFTTSAGVAYAVPADVELWVMQTTSKFYNSRTLGVKKEEILELGSVQYEPNADIDINFDLLKPYRLEVGFGGFFLS